MKHALLSALWLAPMLAQGQVDASLQISYVNSSGARTFPQASTPISFGQLLPAAGANLSLGFTVTNPATASGAVTVSAISVSGAPFSLANVPATPASIAPGASIGFNAIFTPTAAGNFAGTLFIGDVQFSLAGVGTAISSPFTFYIHDTTGVKPDTLLPAAYQAAATPVGGSSPTVLKVINSSQNTVYFVTAVMSTSATSVVAHADFSVTGLFADETLPPGGDLLFTVNFTPTTTGTISGFLNVEFQIQQNGCSFTSSVNGCPSGEANVSTFTGTADPPLLVLSYQSPTGPVVLLPSSASPLNFPNTSLSATSSYTFTLTNETAVEAATPQISLPSVDVNAPSAFTLDTSTMAATIPAGQSTSFSVTFAPGQAVYANGVLQVGANSCVAPSAGEPLSNCYPIAGEGIIATGIDALQISYTNSTGVRTEPQAATPISFGPLIPGSGASAELKFSLTLNPNSSALSVTVPSITVTGAAFSLVSLPTLPVTIAAGGQATFTLVFTPTATGNFTGVLSIGGRDFTVNGAGIASPFPGASMTLAEPIASDQQATLSVHLSPPLSSASVLTLMMQFTPSVTGAAANTDSAIVLGTGGTELTLNLAANSTTATYTDANGNQQSGIPFQTGTTAGAITFSLNYLGSQIYSQTFTITPAAIQITSVQALRESPNLVVTINGYDNTYSASQLSYTFYDTSGNIIGTTFEHNESTAFQQLYFNGNTGGGLFSLQSIFPLATGDVTQVGSVTVGVTNSLGQTTSSATFK